MISFVSVGNKIVEIWTPEWQKKEREVDEALVSGDVQEFDSVEELLKDLKS